jgi:hypothetical protein
MSKKCLQLHFKFDFKQFQKHHTDLRPSFLMSGVAGRKRWWQRKVCVAVRTMAIIFVACIERDKNTTTITFTTTGKTTGVKRPLSFPFFLPSQSLLFS